MTFFFLGAYLVKTVLKVYLKSLSLVEQCRKGLAKLVLKFSKENF